MTWFKENGTKGSKEDTMKRRERIIMRTFRRSRKRREAPTERLARKWVLLAATASLFAATLAPLGLPGAPALAESGNVKVCDLDASDEGITFKSITHKSGKVNSMLNPHARCGQGFPVAGD